MSLNSVWTFQFIVLFVRVSLEPERSAVYSCLVCSWGTSICLVAVRLESSQTTNHGIRVGNVGLILRFNFSDDSHE